MELYDRGGAITMLIKFETGNDHWVSCILGNYENHFAIRDISNTTVNSE